MKITNTILELIDGQGDRIQAIIPELSGDNENFKLIMTEIENLIKAIPENEPMMGDAEDMVEGLMDLIVKHRNPQLGEDKNKKQRLRIRSLIFMAISISGLDLDSVDEDYFDTAFDFELNRI